ncbi:lipoate--protein ligase family protein [bacterium]|nr:MAG: lipoate--protein ligase family protein [bacterium]
MTVARLTVIRDVAADGATNMDRDRDLLASHRPEHDPVLRLYRWSPPALSIGYNQDEAGFDLDAVAAAGMSIVRRPTGGRAILHADELTYAVFGCSPGPLFGATLHETYMTINRALVSFLRGLGAEVEVSAGEPRSEAAGAVCFKSAGRHEIAVGGRKLVGSAQRRHGSCFLQHGSILAGPGHLQLPRYLVPGTPGAGLTPDNLAELTTDLSQVLGHGLTSIDLDNLEEVLAHSFAASLELEPRFLAAGAVP